MTTYRSALEQMRENKKPLSLWFAYAAILVVVVALFSLNHSGPFTALKGVFIGAEAVILVGSLTLGSIRATIISAVLACVILTM